MDILIWNIPLPKCYLYSQITILSVISLVVLAAVAYADDGYDKYEVPKL